MTTTYKCAFNAMFIGGLLLSATAARAQSWTSVASTCLPGVPSAGLYKLDAGTFEFADGSAGQIKARCQVTNPLDSGVPKWTTLVVGYVDPDGTGINYQVNATLYRIARSTGTYLNVKTFDSSAFASTGPTSHSVTFTHTFDFTNYAYYVGLIVTRGDTAGNPGLWFLQLK